jgi:hypothetical protein
MISKCKKCEIYFNCSPGPDCWCTGFPIVARRDGDSGCLCPICLGQADSIERTEERDAPLIKIACGQIESQ